MSVILVAGRRLSFVGLSSDSKPTATPGSSFYETDTRLQFIYDGAAWKLVSRRQALKGL